MVVGLSKYEFDPNFCQRCSSKPVCLIACCLQVDNKEHLRQLRLIKIIRMKRNETLYLQGGPAVAGLYSLCHGQICLSHEMPTPNKEYLIGLLKRGDLFGVEGLFDDHYYDRAKALEESQVVFLAQAKLDGLLVGHPQLALWLLGKLSRMCMAAADRVLANCDSPLDERLLNLLSDLSDGRGRVQLIQAQLAQLLGVTRPTINAHLKQLQRQGQVEVAQGKIRLLS